MTKKNGWLVFIGGLIMLLLFIGYLSGYRFSSLAAARANSFIGHKATPFAQMDTPSGTVILFNTPSGPRTVMAYHSGFLWRAPVSTYLGKESPGPIHTVGWMSIAENHHAFTMIAVAVSTSKIRTVSIGPRGDRETQTAGNHRLLIFHWNRLIPFDTMNPLAYSRSGNALYRYESNPHDATQYLWLPIKNGLRQ